MHLYTGVGRIPVQGRAETRVPLMRSKWGAIQKLSLPKRIIASACNFKGFRRLGPYPL